jgi:hypothetical protein
MDFRIHNRAKKFKQLSASTVTKLKRFFYTWEALDVTDLAADYYSMGGVKRFIAERMGEEEPLLLRMLGKVPEEVLKTGPDFPGIITAKSQHIYEANVNKVPKLVKQSDLSQVGKRERSAANSEPALKKNIKVTTITPTKTPVRVPRKGRVYHPSEITANVKVNSFMHPKTGKEIVLQKQFLPGPNYHKFSERHMMRMRKLAQDSKVLTDKLSLAARTRLVTDVKGLLKYGSTMLKSPWGKRTVSIGLSVAAFNIASSAIHKVFHRNDSKAIPDDYEKGYDIITESMTDFGSPVNIAKAAQKVIMPYYSTVRKATKTSVAAVLNSNRALAASKFPIGHTRY